jgi:acyl-CoA dehydrogenase
MQVFQNGPTQGHDVFLPLDAIIGGQAQIGQGWRMLTTALAEGRGHFPAVAVGGGPGGLARAPPAPMPASASSSACPSLGKFEGVAAPLGRIAASAYLVDGARRLTCVGSGPGSQVGRDRRHHESTRHRAHAHGGQRRHGHPRRQGRDGRAAQLHGRPLPFAMPISITVEGANILTRNLMIFGQGAIRCHPFLLKEMMALDREDRPGFYKAFNAHLLHAVATLGRALGRSWTRGAFAPRPVGGRLGATLRAALALCGRAGLP